MNKMRKKIKLRLMKKGEEKEVLKVYNEIFELNASLEYWKWKYSCPGGSFNIVALNDNGKIIGHYGTQIKNGLYFKKNLKFINAVDVGIKKEYRGNNFYMKALNYQKKFKLFKKKYFAYNFPREAIIILAKKHNFSDGIMLINIYSKKIYFQDKLKKFLKLKKGKLKIIKINSNKFSKVIDYLWENKKKEFTISIIKNWEFIEWYTLKHPNINNLFGIYLNKTIIGYFSILIKEKICYITDILILNKYLTKEIIDEIEKMIILENNKVNEIKILINDNLIEKILAEKKYKISQNMTLSYFGIKKKIDRNNMYITYADTDIL
ncbi:MAG: hypothetical protein QW727_01160 [Candidatus Pacearchaeota archaeon]